MLALSFFIVAIVIYKYIESKLLMLHCNEWCIQGMAVMGPGQHLKGDCKQIVYLHFSEGEAF